VAWLAEDAIVDANDELERCDSSLSKAPFHDAAHLRAALSGYCISVREGSTQVERISGLTVVG